MLAAGCSHPLLQLVIPPKVTADERNRGRDAVAKSPPRRAGVNQAEGARARRGLGLYRALYVWTCGLKIKIGNSRRRYRSYSAEMRATVHVTGISILVPLFPSPFFSILRPVCNFKNQDCKGDGKVER